MILRKCTPGPWRCARRSETGRVWLVGTGQNVVATTPYNNPFGKHDAHMLAASLGMYEELTLCADALAIEAGLYFEGDSDQQRGETLLKLVARARAALAKAVPS